MIQEIAEIDILPGHETAFEAAVTAASPHFQAARGCHGLSLLKSDEFPLRYRLIVDWDSVEDHMVHFRQSDGFQAWRAHASPHFAAPPRVEHVRRVVRPF